MPEPPAPPALPARGRGRGLAQAGTAREGARCSPGCDSARAARPLSRVGAFPGAACGRPVSALSPTAFVITLFLEQEVPLPTHDSFLSFFILTSL